MIAYKTRLNKRKAHTIKKTGLYKGKHVIENKINSSQSLINIDYLIVNLEGQPFGEFPENSNFRLLSHEYGTKIFSNRSDLFYKNEKIGVLMSSPRSAIMSEQFAQLQFENHLFYTKSHIELREILNKFTDETKYTYKSINRLDISIDNNDSNNFYRGLYNNLTNGEYLISGRPKNISAYLETYKGKTVLNGFQVGKRTSDKIIRCYNKTLSLQLTEKPYINKWYEVNGMLNENVWRFEYQLNAAFFRDLKRTGNGLSTEESITWGIFETQVLTELLKRANKGFFEIRENTGKSQVNKEKEIPLFDFDKIRVKYTESVAAISKLKRVMETSTTIKKRLAKSLFREYYSNNQDISYIVALNLLLEQTDMTTETKLQHWFKSKINFYLHEFRLKEKIINHFDFALYHEHEILFL